MELRSGRGTALVFQDIPGEGAFSLYNCVDIKIFVLWP